MSRFRVVSVIFISLLTVAVVAAAGDRALTYEDLMKFRQIEDSSISDNGAWIAYALVPDRGDGEVVVRSTAADTEYRIERGARPVISSDGLWAAAEITPTLEEREQAKDAEKDDKPRKGLSLVDLKTGHEERIDEVESFAFAEGGRWLAFKRYEAKDEEETEEPDEAPAPTEGEEENEDKQKLGTAVEIRRLGGGGTVIENVASYAMAEHGAYLAYAVSAPAGEGNGVFVVDLSGEEPATSTLHGQARGSYSHLSWAREADHLAFAASIFDDEGEGGDAEIWVWAGQEPSVVVTAADAPEGFAVPSANELEWSRDGQRLFFGFKHVGEAVDAPSGADTDTDTEDQPFDPYDFDAILEGRGVDVWHWNDPRIIPNQKERWEEHEKNRVYRAVVHLDDRAVVPLATLDLPEVFPTDNPSFALAGSDLPYLREITWDGTYGDVFVVDLRTGKQHPVVERLSVGWRGSSASLSPDGRSVLFYQAGDWHLWSVETREAVNLTAALDVPFANEDHDYPMDPPGYGHSEWMADSSSVLIYDKYDIWQVFTDDRKPRLLTAGAGRENHVVYRVEDLDPDEDVIAVGTDLLLSAYHDVEKHDAFAALDVDQGSMRSLYATGRHKLHVEGKAVEADRVLFTRERYDEFPDLWVTNLEFEKPTEFSNANPQIADFAWGSAELVEWSSADGVPLQGVLIKPGNYEPGRRYPVLTYYYRFFSQRLHEFNEPVVNHRPSFPIYASDGYAVFLPDIRFEVGLPGPAATKCLVPGLQKLVDMGVADPDALGLHGHSWSGYQTAFVVTQTDLFAAAVAGAPVSNMTSAYSGIRWGTGLARQFQYEKSQSRIGGSLWQARDLYIENSPVFFADRINTPLLIQHGDKDEAVPWYQAIELYLACRRLDKNCIFLQYRDEPHHLKIYANKLDYSIKMKQFFDHYLKGEAAPVWITEGVPYRGE